MVTQLIGYRSFQNITAIRAKTKLKKFSNLTGLPLAPLYNTRIMPVM